MWKQIIDIFLWTFGNVHKKFGADRPSGLRVSGHSKCIDNLAIWRLLVAFQGKI